MPVVLNLINIHTRCYVYCRLFFFLHHESFIIIIVVLIVVGAGAAAVFLAIAFALDIYFVDVAIVVACILHTHTTYPQCAINRFQIELN